VLLVEQSSSDSLFLICRFNLTSIVAVDVAVRVIVLVGVAVAVFVLVFVSVVGLGVIVGVTEYVGVGPQPLVS